MSILQFALPLVMPLACIFAFGVYASDVVNGRAGREAMHGALIWGSAFLVSATLEYLILPASWA